MQMRIIRNREHNEKRTYLIQVSLSTAMRSHPPHVAHGPEANGIAGVSLK